MQTKELESVINKMRAHRTTQLSVWDIDDTLFETPAGKLKVHVLNDDGEKVDSVTSAQYANENYLMEISRKHGLGDHLNFDFTQFRDSKLFFRYAKAIKKWMQEAKQEYSDARNFFMILTARDDMNDQQIFLQKFGMYGLNMNTNRSHIIRAARVRKHKHEILAEILSSIQTVAVVKYWEDSPTEIRNYNTLGQKFPNVRFSVTDTKVR